MRQRRYVKDLEVDREGESTVLAVLTYLHRTTPGELRSGRVIGIGAARVLAYQSQQYCKVGRV